MVGASNAVNLTDGLDGLAIVPVMIAAGCFALIAYLVGNAVFAELPGHPARARARASSPCSAAPWSAPPWASSGSTRRRPWSSWATPARSPTGGALGAVGVITKHELVLAIIGGLFVLETVSVIVQVASFKLTGKRVFRMAPLHHHFEKMGWQEPTIVIRFWIIAMDPGPGRPLHPEAAVRRDGRAWSAIAGKTVGVLGLARSGLAAARALRRAGADASWPWTTSRRAVARCQAWAPVAAGGRCLGELAALVLSPGVPLTHPAPHPLIVPRPGRRRADPRRHRAVRRPARRPRRSSASPAPTASRPRRP